MTLDALVQLTEEAGFDVLRVDQADLHEWDTFETGFRDRFTRWLATHGDDHPAAPGIRERREQQRTAYEDGYRGVLGMAYLCLA